MRTGMGDRAILQRHGGRVAGCRGLLQHERSLLSGVKWHQHWRPVLGQRQQPGAMSWADGKVNPSTGTWVQSHLQLLKCVPFQGQGVLLKLSSYNLEVLLHFQSS